MSEPAAVASGGTFPVGTFPGGTSVTMLDVYDTTAPDGLAGGSPHLHLASTECYVVIAGSGELHTLDPSGARVTPLISGAVVWFTPGTIHRAVNHGGLRVLVIMGNAGLPEAGDAVMTFPSEIVRDPERYRAAAALPACDGTVASVAARADAAHRRRDLAVKGYGEIRESLVRGDDGPLRGFHAAAAALVADRARDWTELIAEGTLAQAERSLAIVYDLARGSHAHLAQARLEQAPQPTGERGFGMCGRLNAYDVNTR